MVYGTENRECLLSCNFGDASGKSENNSAIQTGQADFFTSVGGEIMHQRFLVLFTIGPVQSFIASARKIEDLWSGSYMLSHLIRVSLRNLYRYENSFRLIFPVLTKEEIEHPDKETLHIASMPNRFTAVMEGTEEQVAGRLRETEGKVKAAFYDICDQAIRTIFPEMNDESYKVLTDTCHHQIDAFLEIYWVAEPYDNDKNFKTIRQKLERRLGALKNDKQYPQMEQHSLVCSVCHERDALCAEPIYEDDRYGAIKRKLEATWNQRGFRFKGSEEEEQEAPQRIKDGEYLCEICSGKRLARDYFQSYYHLSKGFSQFLSVKEIGKKDQLYYGILMMDGDNMGEWLSGDKPEDYSNVSEKLAAFAMKRVPQIVENRFHGRIIYAGGDDVLAFLPVNEVLQAAQALRLAFSDKENGLGPLATASAGLVIVHKKAPLQRALNEARKLEGKAKTYGAKDGKVTKNALALGVHARSGEILEATLPWMIGGKKTVDVLHDMIQFMDEGLSSHFIYPFTEAFASLLHPKVDTYKKVEPAEMLYFEFRRLIQRSVNEPLSREKLSKRVQDLLVLHEAMPTTMDFLFLLKMLTFFNKKGGEKNGKTSVEAG